MRTEKEIRAKLDEFGAPGDDEIDTNIGVRDALRWALGADFELMPEQE